MDLTRKIGIGIVMIVPAFVFGGLVWAWFESWIVVFLMDILIAALYVGIITGRAQPIFRQVLDRALADLSSLVGRRVRKA